MVPIVSDFTAGGGVLQVNSLRSERSGASTSGTFLSRAFDGQTAGVTWGPLAVDAGVPADTALLVEVRTATTQSGLSTAAFAPIAAGESPPQSAQFLQYQLTLSKASSDPRATPVVRSVAFGA